MPPCSSSIFPATNRTHPFIASIARADFSVCVRTSIRPLRDSCTLPIPYPPLPLFLPTYPSCPTAGVPFRTSPAPRLYPLVVEATLAAAAAAATVGAAVVAIVASAVPSTL